jgi:hypothetical protein
LPGHSPALVEHSKQSHGAIMVAIATFSQVAAATVARATVALP